MADMEKTDLRIKRTKNAIRNTFIEMICEMDYEDISVKELSNRAQINRKTFYSHYETLDDLLQEMQNEMVQEFVKRTENMIRPREMDKITREFFLYNESLGKLGERLICSGSYQYVNHRMVNKVMNHSWTNHSMNSDNPYVHNIVMTYTAQSTLFIYRQWIADGRKIPLEEIIKIATQLICNGVNGLNL